MNVSQFGSWNARFVYKYAPWILAAIVLSCAAAAPFAKNLKLHANFLELLPAETPSVVNLKELTSHVGGTSFLICVIESPNESTARIAAERLSEEAAKFESVDYVDNRSSVPAFENRKLLFLKLESVAKLKQDVRDILGYYRRQANPFFVDLLNEQAPEIDVASYELEQKVYRVGSFEGKDKKNFMRVVLVKPRHTIGDFADSRKLFNRTLATFETIKQDLKHPVTLGLTGPYRTRESEYRTLKRDLRWTGIITTVLLAIIMLTAFRNLRCLVYTYLPLSAGIFLTLAFTQIAIGYLNLITAFLVSILLGMGSDYTLHILVSLENDIRHQNGDILKALDQTYNELWKPLMSSMLTTAVAFYAMVISGFEGFRHFGLIAGVGIVISFVVVFYGLPSLFVLGEKYFPAKRKPAPKPKPIHRNGIYAILIACALFSAYSITQLHAMKFNYDFSDLQAKNDNTIELAERIGHYFGVQLNPVGLITPTRERADEITDRINAYIKTKPNTNFDFATSLTTHVPQDQDAKIKILGEIEALLAQREAVIAKLEGTDKERIEELRAQLKAQPLAIDDLPAGMQRQYEGDERAISIVFVYPNDRIIDGRVTKKFVNELRSLDLGPDIKLAGEAVLFADVLSRLENDTPVVMFVSFLTVIGLLFIHFRRPDHVLWVLAPVIIGFLWTCGMAGASDLHYNFINLTILPSILGVGIDSGIYIFDHYRSKRDDNFFVSMQKTSKGVLLSSLTNIAAFASLAFAHHRGMASLGLLGVFGFTSCLLASVYFVPSLIEFYELRTQHIFNRTGEK